MNQHLQLLGAIMLVHSIGETKTEEGSYCIDEDEPSSVLKFTKLTVPVGDFFNGGTTQI